MLTDERKKEICQILRELHEELSDHSSPHLLVCEDENPTNINGYLYQQASGGGDVDLATIIAAIMDARPEIINYVFFAMSMLVPKHNVRIDMDRAAEGFRKACSRPKGRGFNQDDALKAINSIVNLR